MTWAAIAAGHHEEEDEPVVEPSPAIDDEAEVEPPTPEELEDLSLGLAKVWELGTKFKPGVDYELDIQGYSSRRGDDHARRPLFKFVSESVMTPTVRAFMALLDNYEREAGRKERVTAQEKAEEAAFLDLVLNTPCMQYCRAYCVAKRVAPRDFKAMLGSLWFRIYASKKQGPPDSCGFEHVFVGEERTTGQVTGMHNWIQLWKEERSGTLDYKGYVAYDHKRPAEDQPALSLQFSWTDVDDGSVDLKPTSTSIIGSSPELELALFTLVALVGGSRNPATHVHHGKEVTPVDLAYGDSTMRIHLNCIKWTVAGHPVIRTCYPSL